MAEYISVTGIRGWGQMITEEEVGRPVFDLARVGSTARSCYRSEWPGVQRIRPYAVVLQFGHNVAPDADESTAVAAMVEDCRRMGSHPILVTQMPARDGSIRHPTHGNMIRNLAHRMDVPLIELDTLVLRRRRAMAADSTEGFYLDEIHLTDSGARFMAGLVLEPLMRILGDER